MRHWILQQESLLLFRTHDDLSATPDALYECVKAINLNPEVDMIYTDEDKISMNGKEHFERHFKTDFLSILIC